MRVCGDCLLLALPHFNPRDESSPLDLFLRRDLLLLLSYDLTFQNIPVHRFSPFFLTSGFVFRSYLGESC